MTPEFSLGFCKAGLIANALLLFPTRDQIDYFIMLLLMFNTGSWFLLGLVAASMLVMLQFTHMMQYTDELSLE